MYEKFIIVVYTYFSKNKLIIIFTFFDNVFTCLIDMLICAKRNLAKQNYLLLQLIVKDEKNCEIHYVGNIVTCKFFQV